jgi:hypothetical protein
VGASEGEGGDRSEVISADISMSVTNRDPPRRIATFWTVAEVERGTDGDGESEATFGKGRHGTSFGYGSKMMLKGLDAPGMKPKMTPWRQGLCLA